MPPRDLAPRLGSAVAAHRRARKLTQERLAELVGVSTEWISQVERGVGMPSLEMLARIAEPLGMRSSELVAATEDADQGRSSIQRLLAIARELQDGPVEVLIATARALREQRRP